MKRALQGRHASLLEPLLAATQDSGCPGLISSGCSGGVWGTRACTKNCDGQLTQTREKSPAKERQVASVQYVELNCALIHKAYLKIVWHPD